MSSTPPPSTAVVIPTYERPAKLRETVTSVSEQTVDDFRVFVVDDGSESDGQVDALSALEAEYEHVRVIRQTNSGPAAARNHGWRATNAEIVLFTDDDCLVPNNWVESLRDAFEPGVGAVGGPLEPTPEALERSVFARVHRNRVRHIYDLPDEPTTGGSSLPMGGTANIAYRREALEAVNGFDESFPTAAGEDADIQTRVSDAGYEMKFVPTVVEHNDEYSWSSFKERSLRHGAGTYYYARRHGAPRPVWRILVGLLAAPLFILRDVRAAEDVQTGLFTTTERVLSRFGELTATLSSR